jgi:hypothetical protein
MYTSSDQAAKHAPRATMARVAWARQPVHHQRADTTITATPKPIMMGW